MLNWKLGQMGQGYTPGGSDSSFYNILLGKMGLGDISRPEPWDWGVGKHSCLHQHCTPTTQASFFQIDTKSAFMMSCPRVYVRICGQFLIVCFSLQ
jgi:hypothetical protein